MAGWCGVNLGALANLIAEKKSFAKAKVPEQLGVRSSTLPNQKL